jgi:hypothetical protein
MESHQAGSALAGAGWRSVHPYRDTEVIDERAPRTNQAVIGLLAIVALVVGLPWLVALLALQLAVGLTFGRRFCLPCLLYFELIQPRLGEGRIEDSRPPRFANAIGATVLGSATVMFLLGLDTPGWILTGLVAALASLSAVTGFCVGCAIYRRVWGCETCEVRAPAGSDL